MLGHNTLLDKSITVVLNALPGKSVTPQYTAQQNYYTAIDYQTKVLHTHTLYMYNTLLAAVS